MNTVSTPALNASGEMFDFYAALSPEQISPATLAQARRCLLDSIGCGLFGALQPWGTIIAEAAIAEGSRGNCTVYGRGETLAAAPAALCNGTATHGFELDDLIAESIVHPGAVIVPAALAAAEKQGASGMRLLLGIIAGYEAMSRTSLAIGSEPARRGYHTTAVVGPVAAAVAAGVVMNLPAHKLAAAVGLAVSAAGGTKTFAGGSGGGMVKRLHAGRSAEAGVRMCDLASRGFTGPTRALDGKFGLLEVLGGEGADAARLVRGLGDQWAINGVWVKVFPICGWIQGVVQSLLVLRGKGPLDAAQVKRIRVGTAHHAVVHNADPAPTDTMSAQYSIPYCAALAVTGDPADPASYTGERITLPAIAQIAQRVELYADEQAEKLYPKQFASRVELTLANGQTSEDVVLSPHGTLEDPCSESEHEQKFRRLAGMAREPHAVENLHRIISSVEHARTIESLSGCLRA